MVSERCDVERIRHESTAPLISIIVAVRQAGDSLQRCIDSVTGQTYPKKELIIMDGGSTDGTLEILQANTNRISYWKSEPDRGIYHAWNKALDQAKGEWVCFLGADDYFWSHDVLQRIVPYLVAAEPRVRVVYGRVALVNEQGELLEMIGRPWKRVRRRFLQEMVIPHQGVFHHRDLFRQGGFDESFCIAGDYELLLRELRKGEAGFVEDVVVAGWQIGGVSSAPARRIEVLQEIARARRKLRVTVIPSQWWWTYNKAWVRRILIALMGDQRSKGLTDLYRRMTGRPSIWTR